MSDHISTIAEKLGVCELDVVAKASEYYRLMTLKVPRNSLRKGEVCRPVIALDLACQMLQVFVAKASLLHQAAVTAKTYNDSFVICKNFMNISLPHTTTIEMLCLKYGFNSVNSLANSILSDFQSSVDEPMLPDSSEQKSIRNGVAFYIAARKNKLHIPRQKMLDDLGCSGQQFKSMLDAFEAFSAHRGEGGGLEREPQLESPEVVLDDILLQKKKRDIDKATGEEEKIAAAASSSDAVPRKKLQTCRRGTELIDSNRLVRSKQDNDCSRQHYDTIYAVWKLKVLGTLESESVDRWSDKDS